MYDTYLNQAYRITHISKSPTHSAMTNQSSITHKHFTEHIFYQKHRWCAMKKRFISLYWGNLIGPIQSSEFNELHNCYQWFDTRSCCASPCRHVPGGTTCLSAHVTKVPNSTLLFNTGDCLDRWQVAMTGSIHVYTLKMTWLTACMYCTMWTVDMVGAWCVCVHAYMYYSKYAYMYVCMYVCMHVCMYVCVCMCVCVYSESGPHKFVLGIR